MFSMHLYDSFVNSNDWHILSNEVHCEFTKRDTLTILSKTFKIGAMIIKK